MIEEEEIVAETQPQLVKPEFSESSESTDEWEPVKPNKSKTAGNPNKPKRRKTSKDYKEQARESSSLRCMLHCCPGLSRTARETVFVHKRTRLEAEEQARRGAAR